VPRAQCVLLARLAGEVGADGSATRDRMAARVLQLDLSQPLPTIRTDGRFARYGMLWILVKFGVQPLGWVKCRAKQYGNVITPEPKKAVGRKRKTASSRAPRAPRAAKAARPRGRKTAR